jgi:hypothetical protein
MPENYLPDQDQNVMDETTHTLGQVSKNVRDLMQFQIFGLTAAC